MTTSVIARLVVAKSRSKTEKYLIYRYHTLRIFSDEGVFHGINVLRLTNRANKYIGRARRDYERSLKKTLQPEGFGRNVLTIFYVSSMKVIKPKVIYADRTSSRT